MNDPMKGVTSEEILLYLRKVTVIRHPIFLSHLLYGVMSLLKLRGKKSVLTN